MKSVAFAVITAGFLAACSTQSTTQPASLVNAGRPSTQLAENKDPNRKVCNMEKPIGSNIAKRVCFTAAEREKMQERAELEMRQHQHGGQTNEH